MIKMWKGRRALSLLLAFAMLLTMSPPVYSTGNTQDYSANIGGTAIFNPDFTNGSAYLQDDPQKGWSGGISLPFEGLMDLEMVIVDCYVASDGLWYKVAAAEGHTLPDEMVERPWVYQNDIPNDGYPDTLIVTPPAPKKEEPAILQRPTSIVSSNGITVSSDNVELTNLVLTESSNIPQHYYVDQAIAYSMHLSTESGAYTSYATVNIPVPDGWDREKLIGFVAEPDGTFTFVPGVVNERGVFSFTVPHFSDVGVAHVRSMVDVTNATITMVVGQSSPAIKVSGSATSGTYYSNDGCVEYVIADSGSSKMFTTLGVLPTNGTSITIGSTTYTVIVHTANVRANKFVAGGDTITLDAMYELALKGNYNVQYAIVEDANSLLQLGDNGQITTKNTANVATAIVRATVTHQPENTVVGTVDYTVTISHVSASSIHNVQVPVGGTVSISNFSQTSLVINPDTTIATASMNGTTLNIKGVAEGVTSVVVKNSSNENVLLNIHVNPDNSSVSQTTAIYFKAQSDAGCRVYYSINGGILYPVDDQGVIIGINSSTQSYPDGFNILVFTAPAEGQTTSSITLTTDQETAGQFYSLNNGVLHDGSDSDAWPLINPAATSIANETVKYLPNLKGESIRHGFMGSLEGGNMTLAEMRDLFTRALALGCDSAFTFTRNSGSSLNVKDVVTVSEELPKFTGLGVWYKKAGSNEEIKYTDDVVLNIGDTVIYKYNVAVTSKNIYYTSMSIGDPRFPNQVISETAPNDKSSVLSSPGDGETSKDNVFTLEYVLNMDDIVNYPHGKLDFHAVFTYTYKSPYASGTSKHEQNSISTVNVSSIITWTDRFNNVWKVQSKDLSESQTITKNDMPTKDQNGNDISLVGYVLTGWKLDDTYQWNDTTESTYTITSTDSISIMAQWTPIDYTITYQLNGGTNPSDAPTSYNIESSLALPTPTNPSGYVFTGWKVQTAVGNWKTDRGYDGTVTGMYGDVTLLAQWASMNWTITYDLADGVLASGSNPNGFNTGNSITLISPIKTGYTFAGWKVIETTGKNGTQSTWELNKVYPSGTISGVRGNVKLQAQWTINTYTITYNLDGGTNHGSNPATYTVENTITLQNPSKDGYNFLGWYTDAGFATPITTISESTGNLVLYAKWEAALASLTIDVNFANDASKDEEQTFIFHVTGDGVDVTVVVRGSGQVVIAGLTIGKQYIITPKSEWSWRYGAMVTTTVEITVGGSTATFEVNRSKTQWLDSNAYYKNPG